MLPAWLNLHRNPPIKYVNCLVWAEGAGRAYPCREVSDHLFRNSPDSFGPLDGEGMRGERAETQVSPDHSVFSR